MSGIKLTSDTLAGSPAGGELEYDGQFFGTDSNNSRAQLERLVLETAKSATGTSVDFTGIPAWTKRITVMFSGVSTNGGSPVIIQLGTLSGIETSSYLGAAQNLDMTAISNSTNFTNGFRAMGIMSATVVFQGISTIALLGSNIWCFNSLVGRTDYNGQLIGSGCKTLSATLDRIRITTVNGTDTFDAGTINILYEG